MRRNVKRKAQTNIPIAHYCLCPILIDTNIKQSNTQQSFICISSTYCYLPQKYKIKDKNNGLNVFFLEMDTISLSTTRRQCF